MQISGMGTLMPVLTQPYYPPHACVCHRWQSFFLFTWRLSLSYAQECTTTRKKHCTKHGQRIFYHVSRDDSDSKKVLCIEETAF